MTPPGIITAWESSAFGRVAHVTNDGRVILRELLPAGDQQYAHFLDTTEACKAIELGRIPWRLDREHARAQRERRGVVDL